MSTNYTTQGVGHGAAFGQRGPGNGRDFFVAKVNPHIVRSGVVQMTSTHATILLENMPAATTFGIIVTNNNSSGSTATYAVPTYSAAGTLTSFQITSGSSDVVTWAVVSLGSGSYGQGTVQSSPTTPSAGLGDNSATGQTI